MADIRILITSDTLGANILVTPQFTGEFEFKRADGKIYFTHEPGAKFIFDNSDGDYALLRQLTPIAECEKITMLIDRKCGSEWVRYWKGEFSYLDATDDEDQCTLTLEATATGSIACFELAIKDEKNIYLSGAEVEVHPPDYDIEYGVRSLEDTDWATHADWIANPYPIFVDLYEPDDYCIGLVLTGINLRRYEGEQDDELFTPPFDLLQQIWMVRQTATVPCDGGLGGTPVPPSYLDGWTLKEDWCDLLGTSTWVRCPGAGTFPYLQYFTQNPTFPTLGIYYWGRMFNQMLEYLVGQLDCGLSLKSDFFNINAVGDAPANAAYQYAQQFLQNMTIHNKGDIKQKISSNPSTELAWKIKMADLLNDILVLFNVWAAIEDDTLILEHWTFYQDADTLDANDATMVNQLDYTEKTRTLQETFKFMDEDVKPDFQGDPIKYTCGEDEKEHRCKIITTDLYAIELSWLNENVTTKGYVLISTYNADGQLLISDSNYPLSFPMLHEHLHKDGRLFPKGEMNGEPTQFTSWIPYKKQPAISLPFCCQTFNPYGGVETPLGVGRVDEAKENIITDTIEIQVSYP